MAEGNPSSSKSNSTTATSDIGHIKVDELWTADEINQKIVSKPLNDQSTELKDVLSKVAVMLLTANENENRATLSFLKPLNEKGKIVMYHQRKSHGSHADDYAVYFIGKYGECTAAVRYIKQGSSVQGGSSSAPWMAFECFPNLGAIIAVGIACGVHGKTEMCDVIVSSQVITYATAKLEDSGPIPRGDILSASPYLTELFQLPIAWFSDEQLKRLKIAGFKRDPNIIHGIILSGPWLIKSGKVKTDLIEAFAPDASGIEMEATYLFAATQGSKTKTLMVKAVCDFGDKDKDDKFQPTAAMLAAQCVCTLLSVTTDDLLCANASSK